jgi:hypothetical protein
MDTSDFVAAVRQHVRDAAIADTLAKLRMPPGRRPASDALSRSLWFNALAEADATRVEEIVREAVDEAVFGLFAALDGSRTIAPGHFELRHVHATSVLLNDPNAIGLNEVFNAGE